MKIWLVSFVILFCLAQFFLWVKQFFSPLPLYLLGGAFLAIASNYNKGFASFFSSFGESLPQTATLVKNFPLNFNQSVLPPSLQSSPYLLEKLEKTDSPED